MTSISALWTRIRRPGTSLPSRSKVCSHGRPFYPVLDQLEARVVPAQVMQPASLGAGSLVADLGNGQIGVWSDDGAYQAFSPFEGYQGGLNVSTLSRLGDSRPDSIVIGVAAGTEPHVLVVDCATGNTALSFYAFDPQFLGGVSISGGVTRIAGEKTTMIVCGATSGAAPSVSLFDAVTGASRGAFYAFDPVYQGGVRAALSMPEADGTSFVVVSSAINNHVVVFDPNNILTPLYSFLVQDFSQTPNGLYVASADLDNDGKLEIIAGAGQGPDSPMVAVLTLDGKPLKSFNAFASGFQGGTRVAVSDVDQDGHLDILAGSGPGAVGTLNAFNYQDLALIDARIITTNTAGVAPGTNFVLPGPINTTAAYRAALLRGEVREVSSDLIGNFFASPPAPDQDPMLYPNGIDRAWVASSDSLYSLLVLNQRYPITRGEVLPGASITVNSEVIDAMARVVGFPFQEYVTLEGWELKFTVFRADALVPKPPTLAQFFSVINAHRPDSATNAPMPPEVLALLQVAYRPAALGTISPPDVYSQLSGLRKEILLRPEIDKTFPAYDVWTNPINDPEHSPEVSDPETFRIYAMANNAVGPYYADLMSGGWSAVQPTGWATQQGVDGFFDGFANSRIADGSPQAWKELAIGMRVLMAMSYDASPLCTTFGLGYNDMANPFVGLPYNQLTGINTYAGQEFLVDNIKLPPDRIDLIGETVTPYSQNPYLTKGFFQLDSPTTILSGLYNNTPPTTSYQWNGNMIDTGTMVLFKPDSVSSDTVSAAGLPPVPGVFNLHPTSTILVNGVATELRQLPGLASSNLPDTFATYVSMAGGVDRVEGSPLSDVIIGPIGSGLSEGQLGVFNGRLTVNAGAGNDVVSPGRGGSLVSLGVGSDLLVLGQGDLFGQTVLLDFKGLEEGDQVVIDPAFIVDGASWGTDMLRVINPANGSTKVLLLTGQSDLVWQPSFVSVAIPVAGPIKTPAEFRTALLRGEVREVSPDLIGNFYNSRDEWLGKTGRPIAWVVSSDTLYSVLVLNQRYPATGGNDGTYIHLNMEVVDAMARIVGFQFVNLTSLKDWGLKFEVMKSDLPVFQTPVPTLGQLFSRINAARPDSATTAPLPAEVLALLQDTYRQAALGAISPVEVYSQLSGLTRHLLVQTPVTSSEAWDLVTNHALVEGANYLLNVSDPETFRIYNLANQAIGALYKMYPQLPYGQASQDRINAFFTGFADSRIADGSPQALHELAIGMRVLMAMAYDSSPLWSSFGIGFSNAANPFVGLPVDLQEGLNVYAGQEFLATNIPLPPDTIRMIGEVVTPYDDRNPYLTQGFFQLNSPTTIWGTYQDTPARNDYQWNGSLVMGAIVAFDPDSVSSDTVSAAGMMPPFSGPIYLHPTSTIDVNGVATELRQLPGLASANLPANFAIYVSMAGGVDRVDGSRMSDVIIGTIGSGLSEAQLRSFSGRLTVNAGAGDDVVSPGRGGSLVSLGAGSDLLVLGQGDLFGQTVLLDFKGQEEGDRVVIDRAFVIDDTSWGTDMLRVTDPANGSLKELLLTGESDLVWQRGFVTA